MFSRTTFGIFFGILVIIIPDATSYSKYGRTCKDIGCRSDETCVMAEDPCHGYSDQCGRYPTCKRISDVSCTTMVCGQNEYCKSENGAPKCVRKSIGSENDEIEARVPTRQSNYPTEAEMHPRGSSDTSNLNGQSYPIRSSGYPSGLGYPSSNGYPSSGSSRVSDSTSTSESSGYPFSGSSGYPPNQSSGYPSSGSSGYPSSGSSGYPSSRSGYPSSGSSGASSVNVGYPNHPRTSAYPDGNLSYRGNYPIQNSGYPSSNYPYSNQYPPYSNQGNSNSYPQNYPQGYYQNQNYMTTTKKPGIREQLTNIARNVAERVLTQAIVDRVTGRHS